MTETSLSLINILAGIAGANIAGWVFRKYSLGITGNTISGVFGSILLSKSIGRLGVDPVSIMANGTMNVTLFSLSVLLSALGGLLSVLILGKLRKSLE
ncbi:MAG: hypothetical protein JXR03_10745 [Cyclobacteriaceae bacterium]